jgi:hypothetical protein
VIDAMVHWKGLIGIQCHLSVYPLPSAHVAVRSYQQAPTFFCMPVISRLRGCFGEIVRRHADELEMDDQIILVSVSESFSRFEGQMPDDARVMSPQPTRP